MPNGCVLSTRLKNEIIHMFFVGHNPFIFVHVCYNSNFINHYKSLCYNEQVPCD